MYVAELTLRTESHLTVVLLLPSHLLTSVFRGGIGALSAFR